MLFMTHSSKQHYEIQEYFKSSKKDVNSLFVSVEAEDHHHSEKHCEVCASYTEVCWWSNSAKCDDDRMEKHDSWEKFNDLIWDRDNSCLFPLKICFLFFLGKILRQFFQINFLKFRFLISSILSCRCCSLLLFAFIFVIFLSFIATFVLFTVWVFVLLLISLLRLGLFWVLGLSTWWLTARCILVGSYWLLLWRCLITISELFVLWGRNSC